MCRRRLAADADRPMLHWLTAGLTNPRFWQWFHAVQAVKWVLLFPAGMVLWRESVPFLMYVSLDTALTGALAAYGAALGARKADPEDPL